MNDVADARSRIAAFARDHVDRLAGTVVLNGRERQNAGSVSRGSTPA